MKQVAGRRWWVGVPVPAAHPDVPGALHLVVVTVLTTQMLQCLGTVKHLWPFTVTFLIQNT